MRWKTSRSLRKNSTARSTTVSVTWRADGTPQARVVLLVRHQPVRPEVHLGRQPNSGEQRTIMLKNEQYLRALALESAIKLVTSEEYMRLPNEARVHVTLAEALVMAAQLAGYLQSVNLTETR